MKDVKKFIEFTMKILTKIKNRFFKSQDVSKKRAHFKKYFHKKYHTDPEFREKRKESSMKWYHNNRERALESRRKYFQKRWLDPEFRKKRNKKNAEYQQSRYRTDSEFRKKIKQSQKKYYLKNKSKIIKANYQYTLKRYKTDPEFRKRKIEQSRKWFKKKYETDPEFRKRYLEKQKSYYMKRKLQKAIERKMSLGPITRPLWG